MNRIFFAILFKFLLTFLPLNMNCAAIFAQSSASSKSSNSSHIENPSFGPSSRFKILDDENVKSEREKSDEQDKISQQKNPQYQKSLHAQNAAVRKFSALQIEEKHPENIQDFLTTEGLFVMTTGGTGAMSNLSYKGYAGFCIKVYIDGILSNNSTTGEFDWNSIDVNSIETIEVQDVPSLSETEMAGCIIRITTKNGGNNLSAETFVSSYEKNIFDTWGARVRYEKDFEKFNYNLGVNLLFAENEFERNKRLGTEHYNFSNQGNVNFGWNAKLSEKINIFGSNMLSYNRLKANRNFDLNTGIETDIATRNNINFSYKNQNLKSDTSFYYNFSNVKYVNNYLTNAIDNTTINKFALSQNILWLVDFTASVESEFIPNSKDAFRFTQKIGAAKKFEFGRFYIEPQVIVFFWQASNRGFEILPRLTMGFEGFTLAGFREFILPTFNHLYWPDEGFFSGNSSLTAENGWSGFLGFRRSDFPLWAQYKISYYGNKICWITENGKMMPKNCEDGIYNVVTIGTTISMFNDVLGITADSTYTSAKLCQTQKQIMWVPEWQVHAGIAVNYQKFSFNADYSFVGARYDDNENNFYYSPYHLLNASISYKFNKSFNAYFKVSNILDQRVVYHDNYYMPSRKFTIGVNVKK